MPNLPYETPRECEDAQTFLSRMGEIDVKVARTLNETHEKRARWKREASRCRTAQSRTAGSDIAVEYAIQPTFFGRHMIWSSIVAISCVTIVVRNMVKIVVEAFRAQAQSEEVAFAVLDFCAIVLVAEEVGVNPEVGSLGVVEGGQAKGRAGGEASIFRCSSRLVPETEGLIAE